MLKNKFLSVLFVFSMFSVTACSYLDYFDEAIDDDEDTVISSDEENINENKDIAKKEEKASGNENEAENTAPQGNKENLEQNVKSGLVADTQNRKYDDSFVLKDDAKQAKESNSEAIKGVSEKYEAAKSSQSSLSEEKIEPPKKNETLEEVKSLVEKDTKDADSSSYQAVYEEPQNRVVNDDETIVIDSSGASSMHQRKNYYDDGETVYVGTPGLVYADNRGKTITVFDVKGFKPLSEINSVSSRQGVSMLIASVQYLNGSAYISDEDAYKIKEAADAAISNNGYLRVVGHSSARTKNLDLNTHDKVNFELSQKRAKIVANALVKAGIDKDKIFVGAVSDAAPIYQEYMPLGEAKNRRTEIFLEY